MFETFRNFVNNCDIGLLLFSGLFLGGIVGKIDFELNIKPKVT